MDKVRAKFLPIFIKAARERLARASSMIESEDPTAVHGELHALAGEAALLGLEDIAAEARTGESAARRWRESGENSARAECVACAQAVGAAVDALTV